MKENTLSYGLYKFQFQVTVTFNGKSQISSNVAETYVQIIPTGLAVFGLENGVGSVMIGSKQSFRFEPSKYSIDLDYIIKADSLSFVYYCTTVNLSDPNSALNSIVSSIDLLSYSINQGLLMGRSLNCFGNSSKINKKM